MNYKNLGLKNEDTYKATDLLLEMRAQEPNAFMHKHKYLKMNKREFIIVMKNIERKYNRINKFDRKINWSKVHMGQVKEYIKEF